MCLRREGRRAVFEKDRDIGCVSLRRGFIGFERSGEGFEVSLFVEYDGSVPQQVERTALFHVRVRVMVVIVDHFVQRAQKSRYDEQNGE
jgi:hypothetical protein